MNANEQIKVLELRNYLLKPGARDRFIDYFERHFVESQNALGGFVLGAFRVGAEPDRFVWLRGFSAMTERSRFLPAFYGGAHWKKFGPEANEMMLEWHRVHLLKPLAETRREDFSSENDLLAIDFYATAAGEISGLIESLRAAEKNGASFWTGETAENDFPRLPVVQDENLLVAMTGYRNRAENEASRSVFGKEIEEAIQNHERLILSRAF